MFLSGPGKIELVLWGYGQQYDSTVFLGRCVCVCVEGWSFRDWDWKNNFLKIIIKLIIVIMYITYFSNHRLIGELHRSNVHEAAALLQEPPGGVLPPWASSLDWARMRFCFYTPSGTYLLQGVIKRVSLNSSLLSIYLASSLGCCQVRLDLTCVWRTSSAV